MRELQVNEKISGFSVLRAVRLEELKGTLYEMEHDGTGLKLVWIAREEENKTFGIAFTTLPEDDTGVFHILEHSVLCGSELYPVKEPFVELVKNSLNTFLNAMTFPDKTLYPISSRNSKDFVNLMRVYLDAVFRPAIYTKPEIFMQEGWHIEFDKEGNPSYKGVVFNEMKGVFADPDALAEDALSRMMLPDTPYAYVSGGDPAAIPTLTYENFIDTHKRFYSPSNGFVYLDGNLDIEGTLDILDGEYLAYYGRSERIAPPCEQKAVDAGTKCIEYEISPEEDAEGKTRLIMAFNAGRYYEREKLAAIQVLNEVIAGNNHSPLVECILDEGLAEDVIVSIAEEISQPYARIEFRNIKDENVDKVRKIALDKLAELRDGGLSREELKAAMANLDFNMRERDFGSYPQGLIFSFIVFDSWLYGGKPEANLEIGDMFKVLAEKMEDGYFEQLLDELYLRNDHKGELILMPSKDIGVKRRAAEQERLVKTLEALSEEQIAELKAMQASLIAWQESEDTPEQLATLPHLALEDIQDMPEDRPTELRNILNTRVLYHRLPTNGINYISMFWDIDGLTTEQYSELSFLSGLLGAVATEKSSVTELANRNRLYCGSLTWDTAPVMSEVYPDKTSVKFLCHFSTLPENLASAAELVAEIAGMTQFADENEVRNILKQNRVSNMQRIIMGGHSVGINRLAAMYHPAGVIKEYTRGLEYYNWLKKTDDSWNWEELKARLEAALEILKKSPVTVSCTADDEIDTEQLISILRAVLTDMKSCPDEPADIAFTRNNIEPWGKRREGIVIPADIAFAERGGNICEFGEQWSSILALTGRIVSYEYLWNVIRVQGGAYGAGMIARRSGLVGGYTYRDPSGAASLESFTTIADFVRKFAKAEPDLTGFIIGTVSDASPLEMPRAKGIAADMQWFAGLTYENRCRERRKLLNATTEQIFAYAESLQKAFDEGGICIVGGQEQIDKCVGLDSIMTI